MKPRYSAAMTEAKKRDEKLRANDPRLNIGGVYLSHDDGSSFFWQSAFIQRWRGYVMVFTEHHGFRVYDNDDVVTVAETQRNKRT
jgi:hypothetical protein